MTAQRAELMTLTKALKFGKDKVVNITLRVDMHLPLQMFTGQYTVKEDD
jgi:ribonuclease HI